ncbi:MAG: hypothetical protein ACJ8FM_02655 [Xanthobacteraceae bacterium]
MPIAIGLRWIALVGRHRRIGDSGGYLVLRIPRGNDRRNHDLDADGVEPLTATAARFRWAGEHKRDESAGVKRRCHDDADPAAGAFR